MSQAGQACLRNWHKGCEEPNWHKFTLHAWLSENAHIERQSHIIRQRFLVRQPHLPRQPQVDTVTARTFSQRNSSLDLLVSFDLKTCEMRDFPYLNSQSNTKVLSSYFSPPKENRLMADLLSITHDLGGPTYSLTPPTKKSVSWSKQLRNEILVQFWKN